MYGSIFFSDKCFRDGYSPSESTTKQLGQQKRNRKVYLNKVQKLIQVLHLIPLCLTITSAGVQAGPLDGSSVQGQIHGFSIQLYCLMAHCLVHVTVQLICCMDENMLKNLITSHQVICTIRKKDFVSLHKSTVHNVSSNFMSNVSAHYFHKMKIIM